MQNDLKKRKKRQKRTHMSAAELKRLRREMKYGPCDMYRALGLARRTYQDYEAGKRGIPQDVAVKVRGLHRRDREFMAGLPARIGAALDHDFPGGIIGGTPWAETSA
ncbi:XRE family transcriptional regulator [bacterium]|nr:XRE family transcriptional regulator [bacterium]